MIIFIQKYWKIFVGLLFALAVILGLYQASQNPYALKSSGTTDGSFQEYLTRGQEAAKLAAPENSKISFLAVGDINLSRNVAAKIKEANNPDLPFSAMKEIFSSVDFSFGNLESPITKTGIIGGHAMVFAAPETAAKSLIENKFKILHFANNHTLDQGEKGLNYSLDFLKQNNIQSVGTGKNLDEAWQPVIFESNNVKICFVGASYASINDNGKTRNDFVARIEDIEKLKAISYKLKANCDFVVVSMHAGTEYTRKPNAAQIAFAHAAIDAGADMVIGHHPHWIQTIEKYCPLQSSPPNIGGVVPPERDRGGTINQTPIPPPPSTVARGTPPLQEENPAPCPNPKYIFYSLGNFIFDQMWSQDTREGLALKITLTKSGATNPLQGPRTSANLKEIELIPVIIENYSTPRPANKDETKKILEKINETNNLIYSAD